MTAELVRITAKSAGELLQHFDVQDDSKPFVDESAAPAQFIKTMEDNACYLDAVKFLAHALPKRESVWWACLAAKQSMSEANEDPDSIAALKVAEQWAIKPTTENRALAKSWSEKTAQKTAASWAVTAAFWSDGNLTKPGEPEIPVPPYLYAHAVAGAISLSVFQPDPDKAEEKYKHVIKQGLNLAAGGNGEI